MARIRGDEFTVVVKKEASVIKLSLPEVFEAADSRILIIDPNPATRSLRKLQYWSWGIQVETTSGAEEAVTMIAAAARAGNPYSIAVVCMMFDYLEQVMSDSGKQLVGTLSNSGPDLVLVTVAGQRGDAIRAGKLGFSAYLTKSATLSQQINCFELLLGRREAGLAREESSMITNFTLVDTERNQFRILVYDRDPNTRQSSRSLLKKFSSRVEVASNEIEMIDKLSCDPFDLILFDAPPVPDGSRILVEKIRKLESSRKPKPMLHPEKALIVAMVTGDNNESRAGLLTAGINDMIAKPLVLKTVTKKLGQWRSLLQLAA